MKKVSLVLLSTFDKLMINIYTRNNFFSLLFFFCDRYVCKRWKNLRNFILKRVGSFYAIRFGRASFLRFHLVRKRHVRHFNRYLFSNKKHYHSGKEPGNFFYRSYLPLFPPMIIIRLCLKTVNDNPSQ